MPVAPSSPGTWDACPACPACGNTTDDSFAMVTGVAVVVLSVAGMVGLFVAGRRDRARNDLIERLRDRLDSTQHAREEADYDMRQLERQLPLELLLISQMHIYQ